MINLSLAEARQHLCDSAPAALTEQKATFYFSDSKHNISLVSQVNWMPYAVRIIK